MQVELDTAALDVLGRFYARLLARANARALEASASSELSDTDTGLLPGDGREGIEEGAARDGARSKGESDGNFPQSSRR